MNPNVKILNETKQPKPDTGKTIGLEHNTLVIPQPVLKPSNILKTAPPTQAPNLKKSIGDSSEASVTQVIKALKDNPHDPLKTAEAVALILTHKDSQAIKAQAIKMLLFATIIFIVGVIGGVILLITAGISNELKQYWLSIAGSILLLFSIIYIIYAASKTLK